MAQTWTTPAGTDPANLALKVALPDRDESLRSLFSGATAPTSPVAYQLWADSATKILKQRNAANSAWVDLLPLADSVRLQLAFRCSGALAAEVLQIPMPMAGRVEKVQIVGSAATSTSAAGTKEWTWMLRNHTQAVDLFSATPSTATVVSGVGGGELAANATYNLAANQNKAVAAGDVLRLTIGAVGSPTAVADVSIRVTLTLTGV
ncbi:MAG: hypothetical protein INH34_14325 [Phycisphaerales bacterium]|nr:hypothetical protein [Phycisphaerales bacterium]